MPARRPQGRGRLASLALAGAVALWLSAAGGGRADTASATQTVRVQVIASLGWQTGHGCTRPAAVVRRCAHGSGRWEIATQLGSHAQPVTLTLNHR
jgi:hypothetical protein